MLLILNVLHGASRFQDWTPELGRPADDDFLIQLHGHRAKYS